MRVKLKAKAVATPADSNVIGKKLLLSTGFCCLHTISLSFRKKLAKLISRIFSNDRNFYQTSCYEMPLMKTIGQRKKSWDLGKLRVSLNLY